MADPAAVSALPELLAGTAGGMASAAGLWAYSIFAQRCQFWAPVVRSLPQRDAVALTFNDGPHENWTPRILDILAEHRVKASFFVIGRYAGKHPAIIRRIHAEGHSLGNHTFDHDPFRLGHSITYWDRQLRQTQAVVADLTGMPPVLVRPRGGYKTRQIAAAARALQLSFVGWSVRAGDDGSIPTDQLACRVLKRATGFDIVLLHDGIAPHASPTLSRQVLVDALPAILRGIADKNLQAVSLIDALVAGSEDIRAAAERTRARTAAS